MVKNRIELFRRLFALGREVVIFVVRYKQKWPPPPRENFIVFHKWFVLKSPKNQSITNILTASVVIRMLIDSLLSNQWWVFFGQEIQRIELVIKISLVCQPGGYFKLRSFQEGQFRFTWLNKHAKNKNIPLASNRFSSHDVEKIQMQS